MSWSHWSGVCLVWAIAAACEPPERHFNDSDGDEAGGDMASEAGRSSGGAGAASGAAGAPSVAGTPSGGTGGLPSEGGRAGSSGAEPVDGGSGASVTTAGQSPTDGGMAGQSSQGGSTQGGAAGGGGGTEPIGGCGRQLLANAGFDLGAGVSWQESSTWPGVAIVVDSRDPKLLDTDVLPHAGEYLAWLGGIPDNEFDHHRTILTQEVVIPSDAATLTLSGQYWVQTRDEPTEEFDEAILEFEYDEEVVWLGRRFTNLDANSAWAAFERTTTELDRLRGRTVTFVAYARTDPSGETSFFLDSLRIEVTCGR